jgi:hypothetical protein
MKPVPAIAALVVGIAVLFFPLGNSCLTNMAPPNEKTQYNQWRE